MQGDEKYEEEEGWRKRGRQEDMKEIREGQKPKREKGGQYNKIKSDQKRK